ncbi:MAG: hypothetical protein WCW40_10615 [Bacteroidota bacterium]
MNRLNLLLGIIIVSIASLPFLPGAQIIPYALLKTGTSLLFLIVAYLLFTTEVSGRDVIVILSLSLLLRLLFINMLPIGSDDIYRYVWDGKVQSVSINPYLFAPNAPELNHLHTPMLPALINQPHMPTMYFPLSEWIFYLSYSISGDQVWGYKMLLWIAEIVAMAGLFFTAKQQQINVKYLLLYAVCPLMIFEYSIDGHVDVFGLMFFSLFLLFYVQRRLIVALVLLGCSFSIKPAALIILPALFFFEKGKRNRAAVAVIPVFTLGLQFLPYMFDADVFASLRAFTKHWTFNGFFFNLFNLYFQDNQPARLTASIVLLIVVGLIIIRKMPIIEKFYLSLLGLLFFSPIVHPWYIGWVGILVPLVRKPSGIYYIAAASLTVITASNYQLYGVWKDYWFVLIIEYVPVIILVLFEVQIVPSTWLTRLSPGNNTNVKQ